MTLQTWRPLQAVASLAIALLLATGAGSQGWCAEAAKPKAAKPRADEDIGAVLLFEPATGKALYEVNIDEPWFPASLTKMMTVYLTLDAVRAGRLTWDTKVPLSDKARAQPATRIGLRKGIDITVAQAVRGVILRSANDFSMALAELIAGSEEDFARLQNDTAKRLGMSRTHFKNPHGLPDTEQMTTARDFARLTMALGRDFPESIELFSTREVRIHKQTFHSQNELLRTLAGADGMKTGFTCGSGYNVVATATREGRRLGVVILGALTRNGRSKRAKDLLEAGFAYVEGNDVEIDGQALKTVSLDQVPVSHGAETPAHDLTRITRTRKCGNRVARRGRQLARPTIVTVKRPSLADGPVAGAVAAGVISTPTPRVAAKKH